MHNLLPAFDQDIAKAISCLAGVNKFLKARFSRKAIRISIAIENREGQNFPQEKCEKYKTLFLLLCRQECEERAPELISYQEGDYTKVLTEKINSIIDHLDKGIRCLSPKMN